VKLHGFTFLADSTSEKYAIGFLPYGELNVGVEAVPVVGHDSPFAVMLIQPDQD